MPSLTPEEVRRIATLARLELNEGEVERLAAELAAILEYAAQVQRVDTGAIDAAHANDRTSEPPDHGALRADAPAPSVARATLLEQAPGGDRASGFFTVPRVFGA